MQAILDWMKEFLIIYLILTILMQLAAADQYKKYLRFISGIILMFVLLSPVLRFLNGADKPGTILNYEEFWERIDGSKQDMQDMEFLRNNRYLQKYEQAAASGIITQAAQQGIQVRMAKVSMTQDYQIKEVSVWLDDLTKQEDGGEERLMAFLGQTYGLSREQIVIYGAGS